MDYDKTEEKSVKVLYHKKDNLAYFSEKKSSWWGRHLNLPEILGQLPWNEIADFEPIFARSTSAVTPI